MSKIQVLDQDIANKIAAGEVVERPGSVIKELVENAIDAGAKHITVEIQNGGITYMRVSDDGCGMNRQDARNCFLRHATSKIRNIADLYAIATLGFRGEALAAISAVSKIEMITSADGVGTRLILEGGKEISCDDTGAPDGTTVIVKELFFNTPARMKFLKTDRSESAYIAALMDRLAFSNPEIAFKLIRDGKVTLSTDGSGKLSEVVYAVFGKEVAGGMLKTDVEIQQVRVYGYVSEPTVTKPNRNFQLCYINGRLVRSQTVFAAIDQAYRNDMFHGRHPVCVIKINLPYGLVDVNVHPSKMEVKFSNEKLIFDAVYAAIKAALNKQTLKKAAQDERPTVAPKVSVATPPAVKPVEKKADPFKVVTVLERPEPLVSVKTKSEEDTDGYKVDLPQRTPFKLQSNNTLHEKPSFSRPVVTPVAPQAAPVAANPVQQTFVEEREEIPYRYIGEVFNAYLLVESGDRMLLIDKHAAHERMVFERLLAEQKNEKPAQQVLLVPEKMQLSHDELAFALDHREEFGRYGFEIDAFGERDLVLRSRPVCLTGQGAAEAFAEILNSWMQGGRKDRTERENLALKTVACKAAIKAGNINDSTELKALVEKLIREDEIHQCPHGRPVMIEYTKKTIEKSFKRI